VPVRRALPLKKIGKTAGLVLLGLIVLDVVATAATVSVVLLKQ
jgi:hypothetical protein